MLRRIKNIKVFMYMKKKIFSLLVLLLTAVTGAWADVIPTKKGIYMNNGRKVVVK